MNVFKINAWLSVILKAKKIIKNLKKENKKENDNK